jgi:hypothetical protein
MLQDSKIVVDGADRLREAGGYNEERRRLRAELARTFEFDRPRVSWWSRLWLEVKLRGAVRTELNKKFPPSALHLAA